MYHLLKLLIALGTPGTPRRYDEGWALNAEHPFVPFLCKKALLGCIWLNSLVLFMHPQALVTDVTNVTAFQNK